MAGEPGKLSDRTTSLTIRVLNEDMVAFEALQKHLTAVPADQLGRILWHLAIWKSADLVADVMRLALAEAAAEIEAAAAAATPPSASPESPPGKP